MRRRRGVGVAARLLRETLKIILFNKRPVSHHMPEVTVSLSPAEYARLEERAAAHGRSVETEIVAIVTAGAETEPELPLGVYEADRE